jgi:energy-coupling factor transport system substrate-specific component
VYVFLSGLYAGFALWWIPYLYVWTVLWGTAMLLPKTMPKWLAPIVYAAVCGLHGLLFGVLYAPSQALLFGMNGKQTLAWIAAGLPFDMIHAVGNVVAGLLICPIILILRKTKEPIA